MLFTFVFFNASGDFRAAIIIGKNPWLHGVLELGPGGVGGGALGALPLLGEGPVPVTLDDTLARKQGLKVFGAGMHYDPLASNRRYAVTSWCHRWVVLAVRVQVTCGPGCFSACRCSSGSISIKRQPSGGI